MKNIDFASMLPPLLIGDELTTVMTSLPDYDDSIRTAPASTRLLKLMDIYRIFIPTSMTTEIYQRLYLMTSMSLRNKGNAAAVRQMYANYIWSHGGEFHGVVTGATSATIIGDSGIGKTSSIQLSVSALGPVIEIDNPLRKIIPVVMVSCPFDCNYRGLLCQILVTIDEILGTNHYEKVQRLRMNAPQILALVCQVCHLSVGLLIIDEIQLLAGSSGAGTLLYKMILQLINSSCINVLLVGTNECLRFFGQSQQIARRSVGLQYSAMEYGADFRHLVEILYRHQYVQKESSLTDNIVSWLYEHSGGIPATLISLIHDAQEIGILKGKDVLNIDTLTEAYNSRIRMLHSYISNKITVLPQTSSYRGKPNSTSDNPTEDNPNRTIRKLPDSYRFYAEMASEAKAKHLNILDLLREQFTVEEVTL